MVRSTVSMIVSALGLGVLLWPATGLAGPKGPSAFDPVQGQEVVAGSYNCDGTVYTDDQGANLNAGAWLSATSGITTGFYGSGQQSFDAPADLDAMAEICESHVSAIVTQIPSICSLGPVETARYVFGNGSSARSGFDFSCQGTRDEVIGVIGGFGRLALETRLP